MDLMCLGVIYEESLLSLGNSKVDARDGMIIKLALEVTVDVEGCFADKSVYHQHIWFIAHVSLMMQDTIRQSSMWRTVFDQCSVSDCIWLCGTANLGLDALKHVDGDGDQGSVDPFSYAIFLQSL